MTMKPIYRAKIVIYDAETEEEVCHEDNPISLFKEDALWYAGRVLRHFDARRSDFEKTYYPDNK